MDPITNCLIVEDDTVLLRYFARMTAQLGLQVTPVATGKVALALLENGLVPDLIIVDVRMRDMSIRRFLAEAKQSCPSFKVLFMSGSSARELIDEELLDPGTPVLQKPFTIPEYEQAIHALLDHKDGA